MTDIAPPQGAQAALRTIRLLKSFSIDTPELSLGELSQRLNLNKSTAHRLLAALESENLIEKAHGRGAYRLSSGTIELGTRALASNSLKKRVRPVLDRLAMKTKEMVSLEVLMGDSIFILDEIDGSHVVGAVGHLGTRWPLHATSSGKGILAQIGVESGLLPDELPAYTGKTLTNRDVLRRDLALVRRRGYAIAVDELEEGFTAVSAVVPDAHGAPRAAVAIGGPTARMTQDRCVELGQSILAEVNRLFPAQAAMR